MALNADRIASLLAIYEQAAEGTHKSLRALVAIGELLEQEGTPVAVEMMREQAAAFEALVKITRSARLKLIGAND